MTPLAEQAAEVTRPSFPLLYSQEAMLASIQLGLPAGMTADLAVPLPADPPDAAGLVTMLRALTERHPALRHRFELTEGGLVQRLEARVEVELEVEHEPLTVDEVRARLSARVARLGLGVVPMARFCLLERDAEGARWLVGSCSHLVADGHSLQVLERDLANLLAGGTLAPAPTGSPFGDYAVRVLPEKLASPDKPGTAPPWWQAAKTVRATRQGDSDRLHTLVMPLPPTESRAVTETARGLRTTPFVIFASAAGMAARPRLGEDVIALRTGINDRGRADRDAVGSYLTLAVLTVTVTPSLTAGDVVRAMHDEFARALRRRRQIPWASGRVGRLSGLRSYLMLPRVQMHDYLGSSPARGVCRPGLVAVAENRLANPDALFHIDVLPSIDGDYTVQGDFPACYWDLSAAYELMLALRGTLVEISGSPNVLLPH